MLFKIIPPSDTDSPFEYWTISVFRSLLYLISALVRQERLTGNQMVRWSTRLGCFVIILIMFYIKEWSILSGEDLVPKPTSKREKANEEKR